MEFLIELLVWLVVEIVVPAFFDGLVDGFVRRGGRAVARLPAAVFHGFAGLALGALSVLAWREPVVAEPALRYAALAAGPVLIGLTAAGLAHLSGRSARAAFWFGLGFGAMFELARIILIALIP